MITIFKKLNRYFLSNWRLAVLDLKKGRWLLEPEPAVIAYLKAENAHGRHILMQPKDPAAYLLADDLTEATLRAHHTLPDGTFKPGRMVVETSPGNFQVWIHFDHPLGLEQKRFLLQRLRSDPGADPNNRFGRCPGFRNRKEKHKSSNGYFPLAKLIWIDWKYRTRIPDGFCRPRMLRNATLSPQPPWGGVCRRFSRDHYNKGDESRTDFAYALSLIRKGCSDEHIRSCILAERPDWTHHQGEKRKSEYLNRTIHRARKVVQESG